MSRAARAASLLWLGLVLASGACGEEGRGRLPPPPKERSNAVLAPSASAAALPAAPASARPVARPARRLCGAPTVGLKAPKGRAVRTAHAAGVAAPPLPLAFGAGKWIWVNLWAAWCGPCKEEMPQLLRWHAELRRAGVLVDLAFVSLDDDERQLRRFLDEQPAGAVRASYWLPEAIRSSWLQPLGVRESAKLPVHAFVSPRGEVACVVDGTVEEEDWPQLRRLLSSGHTADP
ncbi:MAG: TlpA family protein disulfide reductase [Deltaproteobacteria bacterium]|nr:TlpA family protein disulfide reductase [Deltaproteobacteria bacterium]